MSSHTFQSAKDIVVNDNCIDISTKIFIEISENDRIYELLLQYIAANASDARSFQAKSARISSKSRYSRDEDTETSGERVQLKVGFGSFAFVDLQGKPLIAVHASIGDPVGTDCGAVLYKTLTIFTDESEKYLKTFFTDLIEASEKTKEGVISIFAWSVKRYYWQSRSAIRARPLESVILPKKSKTTIIKDITHFLSEPAQNFYLNHGIPYRRSYLLHGVPGTGKTSLIQAIAGHFKRSICFLHATHPEMTDECLACAMEELPSDTIVVLEDIDSLFSKDRSSKVKNSQLTFSGLLNALDGIGSNSGQLVFLTTNLRDQLDPALIRNGRVDFHVHFDYASDEQIKEMWVSYYPDGEDLADRFCNDLRVALNGKPIATAGLQHFFVIHMNSSAEEAVGATHVIVEDMKEKEVKEIIVDEQAVATEGGGDLAAPVTESKSEEEITAAVDDSSQPIIIKTSGKKSDHNIHIFIHDTPATKPLNV